LDPVIEVRPSQNQIDDLIEEINIRVEKDQRILVTTLTKRMAEELTKYLTRVKIRTRYIHSDIDTLERVEIMSDLRKGVFDVLVGVNLLREGLDLPEVSLVAILDADKEGFLRSNRTLTQTIGRAARHLEGRAILYADKITDSMQKTIDQTEYRRSKQIEHNTKHNITPQALKKAHNSALSGKKEKPYEVIETPTLQAAEEAAENYNEADLKKRMTLVRKSMEKAAKDLDFMEAARFRDELKMLQDKLEKEKAS
jgi:excinuclease ABC subunit B